MNVSLAVWTLVFGGWVLEPLDDGSTVPLNVGPIAQPYSAPGMGTAAPEMNVPFSRRTFNPSTPPPAMRSFTSPPAMRSMRNPGFGAGRSSAMGGPATMPGQMPLPMAPTDPGGGLLPQFPPVPTVSVRQDSAIQSPVASPQALSGRAQVPRNPSSYYPTYSYPTSGADMKAFSNYRPPSAVNPNLNRFGRGGMSYAQYQARFGAIGTQNPLNQNQRMSGGVSGVTNMPQQPGPLLRQPSQGTQVMQGIVNPQYYIDYQQGLPAAPSWNQSPVRPPAAARRFGR